MTKSLVVARKFHLILLSSLALMGLLLTSCSGLFGGGYSITGGPGPLVKADLTAQPESGFEPARYNEIVVVPLDSGTAEPISQFTLDELTRVLVKSFETRTSVSVVNITDKTRYQSALEKIGADSNALNSAPVTASGPQQTGLGRAVQLGSALNTQAALYGVVSRFNGRSREQNASKPAAVAFRLWLIDPKSKAVLWTAAYERAEEALSENLFAVKQNIEHGVGYKSADDLAQVGFEQAAAQLEKLRVR